MDTRYFNINVCDINFEGREVYFYTLSKLKKTWLRIDASEANKLKIFQIIQHNNIFGEVTYSVLCV